MGALNMGEYAYDFTGKTSTTGLSRNPHDTCPHDGRLFGRLGPGRRWPDGGFLLRLAPIPMVLFANPASLCGIFGLKPTYGRLSRARSFPFVASLDHLSPLLALCV